MTTLASELAHFHCTEQYYRHFLQRFVYTDGVRYLAQNAQAYWLLDLIASYQQYQKVKKEEFQVWKLQTDLEKNNAVATCDDGNNNILITQYIPFTDFPLTEITLYLTDGVLLLPSEY